MLSVCKLNQYYGESHTLWDLDMDIPEGSCTVLIGRNGVGKTTMLKCIMGLLSVQSGSIDFDGRTLNDYRADQRAHFGVGYVPQGRHIFSQLTVLENLQTGLYAQKKVKRGIPDLVYEIFPVLKDMSRRRGGDLSGGQQQQLAIGRALVFEPKLLLLDEPTEGIQPNIVRDIGSIILNLNKEHGVTVLLVEQKLPFARRVADRFYIMDKGRNIAEGLIDDLNEGLVQKYLTV